MEQVSKNKETTGQNINSQKKARQFDFDLLFTQTIESKQNGQESAQFSRISLHGAVEELTKVDKGLKKAYEQANKLSFYENQKKLQKK